MTVAQTHTVQNFAMGKIPPGRLKALIHGDGEIAILDVREHGQYGEGHLFHAVNCPYSRLEISVVNLVPNRETHCVLVDNADGVADRAQKRMHALGYGAVDVLIGGMSGWIDAGYQAFKGVNVPSKAFGELMEAANHPPVVAAETVNAWIRKGRSIKIFDGRPFSEFEKMNVPGARCVPNGEALYRWAHLIDNKDETVVINCAGRTRGLIGVETLRRAGISNPVFALKNGTAGWALSGLQLERGTVSEPLPPSDPTAADAMAKSFPCPTVTLGDLSEWRVDPERTCYVLDVRTRAEFDTERLAGSVHAPAGQLVQATDQWVAVRRARIVLVDDNQIRARFAATWLRRMGHDAHVLVEPFANGGVARGDEGDSRSDFAQTLPIITAPNLSRALQSDAPIVVDLRPSGTFLQGTIPGAVWSTRPQITDIVTDPDRLIVLVSNDPRIGELAAVDLALAGCRAVRLLDGGFDAWVSHGFDVDDAPGRLANQDRIDFLFFVHDRHDGNADASRRYLAWECGLVDQLDAQEIAEFHPDFSEPSP